MQVSRFPLRVGADHPSGWKRRASLRTEPSSLQGFRIRERPSVGAGGLEKATVWTGRCAVCYQRLVNLICVHRVSRSDAAAAE
ncbi:PREDICTED: uncharacterized protein LOC106931787 isoform X2 [Poecilia mexicana]|uniref:uncharacterized protein LOC106931787 isoform X2 n=1 Tax=Poecilia mexicana TaxID=48701 RepID=UPI00072E0F53|nr:PREDICTED: uncharacterized protein LOC106931787 isoform X2 [Poecilia mexicana]